MKNQNKNEKAKNCGNKNCGKNEQKNAHENYKHGGNND